jgi:hypothetical protein
MRIHLCHGIHTPEHNPAVMGLIPFLEAVGFEVLFPDYPWIAGLATRILNPIITSCIRPYLKEGDIWVGHSNGCAIGYDLMHDGAPISGAVFINGALNPRLIRPPQVRKIGVLYNSGDKITEAAQLAEYLHLVDSSWGELGHTGYEGEDSSIENFNCDLQPGMPALYGHSDLFTPVHLAKWGPWVANYALSLYKGAQIPPASDV